MSAIVDNTSPPRSHSNVEVTNKDTALLPGDDADSQLSRPMRATRWRFVVLLLATGFMFGNFYFFDQISATEKAIESRAHMSEDTFGLLSSVYSWPNVILPLFGGMIIDYFGVRLASVLFTILVLCGSLLFTTGLWLQSTALLIVARVVFGMGGESQNVASLAFIAKWFKGKELAFAVAIDIAVSRLGSVAAFDTQGVLSDKFGVTIGSTVGSAICTLSMCSAVACVFFDWRCDRKDRARGLQVEVAAVDEVVNISDIFNFSLMFWLVTVSCVSTYVAAFPFMQVISAPYLQERLGFAQSDADQIVSNINLTSAFLSPVLGLFVDRFGRRPVLLVFSSCAFLVCHMGLLLFPVCDHCWSVLIFYILMGIALSIYGSVIWPCVPLVVDPHCVGTAFGLTTALQNMGMAISPMLLTKLHSATGGFTAPFIYILGCISIGLLSGISLWIVDAKRDKRLMAGAEPEA